MAVDYKKLFIKSIDKIVFLGFLVFFVVQAFKFVTTFRPTDAGAIPQARNRDFRPEPAIFKERFVLKSFNEPLEPDARHDITTDPTKIEPGRGEKQCPRCGWITKVGVPICPKCKYNWQGIDIPPPTDNNDNRKPTGPVVEGIPFKILGIAPRPVEILFFGYIRMRGQTFLQINFANNTRTSMVPEGGIFQDYRLSSLQTKEVMLKPPGFTRPYKTESYFITIQKEAGQAIEIERGQTVTESLLVATLQALEGTWQVRHGDKILSTGESTFDVYGGDTIVEVGGQTKSFEVIRVKETGVLLKDQEGNKKELPRVSK